MSEPIRLMEDDAIRFISVNRSGVMDKTFQFLEDHMIYMDRDSDLQEDLYSIHEAYDEYEHLDIEVQAKMATIGVQLRTIKDLADQSDAAYVRFIK